jgi:predicted GNAT family N-acyltransferase
MTKIERPKLSEYDVIQRFLEDVYGHSYGYFPLAYPQVWKKQNTDGFKNTFIIKEKGNIVSLLRIFPLKTIQNGVDVNLAGIGSVSTLYSHRGKGYMTELLQHSFQEMEKQKFPLSVLGGDRHRYGNFGYENGGRVVNVTVSPRGIHRVGIKSLAAKRYGGEKDILSKMIGAYNGLSYRKRRSENDFEEIYTKPGLAVYYTGKGKDFAFIVISATESRDAGKMVFEFAGKSEMIPGILRHLSERFGFASFSLSFPDFSDVPESIISAASNWSVSPGLMIKIVNLKQTLQLFSRQPGFFFPEGEEVTLTMEDKESVVMSKKRGSFIIQKGRGKNEVALSEMDMVRLLFGLSFWAPAGIEEGILHTLRQFLPFNLFLGHLDHI